MLCIYRGIKTMYTIFQWIITLGFFFFISRTFSLCYRNPRFFGPLTSTTLRMLHIFISSVFISININKVDRDLALRVNKFAILTQMTPPRGPIAVPSLIMFSNDIRSICGTFCVNQSQTAVLGAE